jgi:hypothetical protein
MDHLADVLTKNNAAGKSSDLLFAFRCFAVDNITNFCFSKSVHALDEPEFAAPIVEAMDHSLPTFHLLTNLQVILGEQVKEVSSNPSILKDTKYPTIYHRLLDPEAHKGNPIPNDTALYEEAQTMMFAGGVTVGDASMTGHFHVLDQPELYKKLQAEVRTVWPDLQNPPSFEAFEGLPLLTATIKESLRMSPGACSPLLRIVPPSGATISGRFIPGGTIVGMTSVLIHQSPSIFAEPEKFNPNRWLEDDAKGLEQWLVAFSKGPRSCLGINLAWCELYILFATMLRRFDMRLHGTTKKDLTWRDCFTPYYPERHLRAWCVPVDD